MLCVVVVCFQAVEQGDVLSYRTREVEVIDERMVSVFHAALTHHTYVSKKLFHEYVGLRVHVFECCRVFSLPVSRLNYQWSDHVLEVLFDKLLAECL